MPSGQATERIGSEGRRTLLAPFIDVLKEN